MQLMHHSQPFIDPTLILKDHIRNKKKIDKQGNYLIFEGGIKLRIDTPTAFIQSQSDKKQYTLGSLWFYLKHRDDPLSVYKTELQKEKIDTVVGIDKDPIIDYFINDNEDVKIIEEDLKEKTYIYLGKKKLPSESLEKINDDEYRVSSKDQISSNNDTNNTRNNNPLVIKKRRIEDLDPNLQMMQYIYHKQKHSLNRNSILRPVGNLIGFEFLFPLCRKTFTNCKKLNDVKIESMSFLDELLSAEDLEGNKAIIIVPQTYHLGNLCIDNARQFIMDANYLNPFNADDLVQIQTSKTRNAFNKKIKGKDLNFEIHSNVRNFTKSDWKRVVAVFVQGSDWEFTDWQKKNESITSILMKIKGFHLKYSDLPTNENVKKWNVKILEINRTKRHYDVSVQNLFWMILEEFLLQPRYREVVKQVK